MNMINRNLYLIHGLAPIDLPERSVPRSKGRAPSLETSDKPANTFLLARLTAAQHHLPPLIGQKMSPRHTAEINRISAQICPDIAPSVYPSDMPDYLSQEARASLYVQILSSGINLESVSRKAIAHEITPPDVYWGNAVRDCIPIIENAILRNSDGQASLPPESLDTLNYAINFLEDQLGDAAAPLGRPEICSSIATIFLIEGSDYASSEMETLMSHFLVHSRIGNRHLRQLSEIAGSLPDDSQKVILLIQEEGRAGETLALISQMFRQSYKAFQEQVFMSLKAARDRLLSEMQSNQDMDMVRLPVLISTIDNLLSTTSENSLSFEQIIEISREICSHCPTGGGDLQVKALAMQVAARRIVKHNPLCVSLLHHLDHPRTSFWHSVSR